MMNSTHLSTTYQLHLVIHFVNDCKWTLVQGRGFPSLPLFDYQNKKPCIVLNLKNISSNGLILYSLLSLVHFLHNAVVLDSVFQLIQAILSIAS